MTEESDTGDTDMSQVILDEALRSKLNGLSEQLEILDESGRTLGRFVPEDAYRQMLYAAAAAACPHSPEELERRRQETGGKTLAEIWQKLGSS